MVDFYGLFGKLVVVFVVEEVDEEVVGIVGWCCVGNGVERVLVVGDFVG